LPLAAAAQAAPLSDSSALSPSVPRTSLPLASIGGLLVLSGAAGLIYQVAWVRLLGLAFGVTIFAISTVLAAFMAGLAIGSIVGGRVADRSVRPLRGYGVVEICVGFTALLTPCLRPGLLAGCLTCTPR
jgi:MFS family permease